MAYINRFAIPESMKIAAGARISDVSATTPSTIAGDILLDRAPIDLVSTLVIHNFPKCITPEGVSELLRSLNVPCLSISIKQGRSSQKCSASAVYASRRGCDAAQSVLEENNFFQGRRLKAEIEGCSVKDADLKTFEAESQLMEHLISVFVNDSGAIELLLPGFESAVVRKHAHVVAEKHRLLHVTTGAVHVFNPESASFVAKAGKQIYLTKFAPAKQMKRSEGSSRSSSMSTNAFTPHIADGLLPVPKIDGLLPTPTAPLPPTPCQSTESIGCVQTTETFSCTEIKIKSTIKFSMTRYLAQVVPMFSTVFWETN